MILDLNDNSKKSYKVCTDGNIPAIVNLGYCKNASSVASFLEVVHCSVDEYLRRILQHLHELHRKVPCFICCDDKDAMTVTTKQKLKNSKRLKS